MRGKRLLTLVLIIVLLLPGCTQMQEQVQEYTLNGYVINNTVSTESLSDAVTIEQAKQILAISDTHLAMSHDIEEISDISSIHYLRQCKDASKQYFYSVHKIMRDDTAIGYVYVFYTQYFTKGFIIRQASLHSEPFPRSAFDGLKNGQTISDVEKIDSMTEVSLVELSDDYICSEHITDGGLFKVWYVKKDGSYFVRGTEYEQVEGLSEMLRGILDIDK